MKTQISSNSIKEGTNKIMLYNIYRKIDHLTVNQLENILIEIFLSHNMLLVY